MRPRVWTAAPGFSKAQPGVPGPHSPIQVRARQSRRQRRSTSLRTALDALQKQHQAQCNDSTLGISAVGRGFNVGCDALPRKSRSAIRGQVPYQLAHVTMRIIALEEAFLHPALRELYPASDLKSLDVLKGRLFDVGPERIRRMDAAKNSSPSANTSVRRSAIGPPLSVPSPPASRFPVGQDNWLKAKYAR